MAQISKDAFERAMRRRRAYDPEGLGLRQGWRERLKLAGEALRIEDVPRPVLVAIAVLCAVAVGLGVVLSVRIGQSGLVVGRDEDAGLSQGLAGDLVERSLPAGEDRAPAGKLLVDVGGAVVAPGVYELDEGSRVVTAIEVAGGLAPDADTALLNQAALLVDGQKVVVPRRGDISGSYAAQTAATSLVSINMADAATLATLPGIGQATADAIVRERETNGPFSAKEDLARVSGIGQKKLAQIIDLITL